MNNVALIETESWDYTCGDGCCYDYGERLYINGIEVEGSYSDVDVDLIINVLKTLGIESKYLENEHNSIDMRISLDEGDE